MDKLIIIRKRKVEQKRTRGVIRVTKFFLNIGSATGPGQDKQSYKNPLEFEVNDVDVNTAPADDDE